MGLVTSTQTRKSPARRIGTPIPVPGRIGNRGFPVFRPNRGFPSRFPVKTRESGEISDSRFPSDVRAATAVDSEYTLPRVSCQCSHRQHAAPIQGLREGLCCCRVPVTTSMEHQPQWTRNILSREASIMPVLSQAACAGSYCIQPEGPRLWTERGSMLLPWICLPRLRKVLKVPQPE